MVAPAFNDTAPGPRPQALCVRRDGISHELARRKRWLVWRYEINKDGAKWTKVPYDAHTDQHGSSTNADTWATIDVAYQRYLSGGYDGIGFAIDPEDGIVGIDIDHCINPNGDITDHALGLVSRFNSYTERSPGNHGLRIFVFGRVTTGGRGGHRRNGIEVYPRGQYLTCTGHGLEGFNEAVATAPDGTLQDLWDSLNPPKRTETPPYRGAEDPSTDDLSLLNLARNAKNGHKFERLWSGDTSDYGGNDSEADMGLCARLAFWTQGDSARMDRLFRASGLMRKKWDEARADGTYGSVTIEKAIANCTEFYKPRLRVVGNDRSSNRDGDWEKSAPHMDEEARSSGVRVCLADVAAEEVTWLWPGRIPFGKVTLLVGDPGLGKSFVSLYLASRLSTGSPLQGETEKPPKITTLLLSAEDDLADTIRPRLNQMDADVTRIFAFKGVIEKDKDERDIERMVRLDTDLTALEQQVVETGARFVVVDPINAYMGKTDGNQDIDLRRVLNPLAMIASRHKVAILVVTHSNKRSEGNKLHRVMGSLAYVGLARSVLAVGADPDAPGRCNMVQIKNNLAAQAGGLGYRIIQGEVVWDSDPVSLTPDTVFDGATGARGKPEADEKTKSVDFLRNLLANGEVYSKDVYAEADAVGLSKRTVDRAKVEMNVKMRREGFGTGGKWYWSLPVPADDTAWRDYGEI